MLETDTLSVAKGLLVAYEYQITTSSIFIVDDNAGKHYAIFEDPDSSFKGQISISLDSPESIEHLKGLLWMLGAPVETSTRLWDFIVRPIMAAIDSRILVYGNRVSIMASTSHKASSVTIDLPSLKV